MMAAAPSNLSRNHFSGCAAQRNRSSTRPTTKPLAGAMQARWVLIVQCAATWLPLLTTLRLLMRHLQVLLLQAVLTALQQDMDARVAVFRAASVAADQGEATQPVSRGMQVVLEHSHLWRLLQVGSRLRGSCMQQSFSIAPEALAWPYNWDHSI